MKNPHDPRHLIRRKALQQLFAWNFHSGAPITNVLAKGIIVNLEIIDQKISLAAPERPLNQINKVDLAILRLAIFELIIDKETPFKVILDEAIELAKEFSSEASSSFINGVLGKIVKEQSLS